jgi:hypothetical protein
MKRSFSNELRRGDGITVALPELASWRFPMRRFLVVLSLVFTPAMALAQGLTVHDIVALSKAGLGDEALLALIDVNRPVFPVDTETLTRLKDAGVAPAVIVAMIKSGRTPPPPPLPLPQPLLLPTPPAPAPQVIVIEHESRDEPRVREVAVPVPVYIPVRVRARRDADDHHPRVVRPAPKPVEPVFWGWGGKLRPDAWKPTTAADVQKDAKVPREPQRK